MNIGAVNAPGEYILPPDPAPAATGYQAGTFLAGVDPTRTSVEHISTFVHGVAEVDELSGTLAPGSFRVTTRLADLTEGRFDVLMTERVELPVICQ